MSYSFIFTFFSLLPSLSPPYSVTFPLYLLLSFSSFPPLLIVPHICSFFGTLFVSFFFSAEWYSVVNMHHNLFNLSSTVYYLWILATTNKAIVNTHVQVLCGCKIPVLRDTYMKVEILGGKIGLTFKEIARFWELFDVMHFINNFVIQIQQRLTLWVLSLYIFEYRSYYSLQILVTWSTSVLQFYSMPSSNF